MCWRLKGLEAKPNGSNEKVSFEFPVKIIVSEKEQQQEVEFGRFVFERVLVTALLLAHRCKEVVEQVAECRYSRWWIFVAFET